MNRVVATPEREREYPELAQLARRDRQTKLLAQLATRAATRVLSAPKQAPGQLPASLIAVGMANEEQLASVPDHALRALVIGATEPPPAVRERRRNTVGEALGSEHPRSA